MTEAENLLRDIPKGLIMWYQFNNKDSVLYIGEKGDALAELLLDMKQNGTIANAEIVSSNNLVFGVRDKKLLFDVIISIEDIERTANVQHFLVCLKSYLKPTGKLLLGANNRLGIRYFCGDQDLYTGRCFDGIENYRGYSNLKVDKLAGHAYSKYEITSLLGQVGFCCSYCYSVFPDLKHPALIYAEDFVPNEELSVRSFPIYNEPGTVFLEEEYLYTSLIQNGLFHKMANAFLIECSCMEIDSCERRVIHVTASIDRGRNNSLLTIIYNDGVVEKRAVYDEGKARLKKLILNGEDLKRRGLSIVEARYLNNVYYMPYIKSETALVYLERIAKQDKDAFVRAMDKFYEEIKKSSELYEREDKKGKEVYLKKGYIDLVPLNCFVLGGKYVFYDQELVMENCPLGAIVIRLIDQVYRGNTGGKLTVEKDFFYDRYNLRMRMDEYRRIVSKFLNNLRNIKYLKVYYDKHGRNPEIVNANRQRMNYSEEEYQRKFVDIFRNLGDRKLILFGSGAFTKRFIAMYGKSYEIACILDNNESRWGQQLDGYEIKSPAYLQEISKEEYKVLICIKSYLSVAKQLETMGITDYGIFDTSRSYAKSAYRQESIAPKTDSGANTKSDDVKKVEKKKYHIGYVAGVFDMFHTGHVRLLQKAKELCDYLIVGVVSDEDCYRQKNKYPVISCEDRVEVVRACRYADQVEALPTGFGGIRDAYKMFQFDVQFSGDDHGDDGGWLAEKEYLNKHGADIVFFDYTKGISSTEIRKKLER